MAKKENEVNLSEIDPTFVISQFKNKERRNNLCLDAKSVNS